MFLLFNTLVFRPVYNSLDRLKKSANHYHKGLKNPNQSSYHELGRTECLKRIAKKVFQTICSFQKCVSESACDFSVLDIPSNTLSILFQKWCQNLQSKKYFIDFVAREYSMQHFSMNFFCRRMGAKKQPQKQWSQYMAKIKHGSSIIETNVGEFSVDKIFHTACIVGDPHIKTVEEIIYKLPEDWNYVNLFFNRQYEISITAECGTIGFFQKSVERKTDENEQLIFCGVPNAHKESRIDKTKQIILVDGQYFSPFSDTFPDHVRENNYFRKIKIQYKNEYLILCPDTFDIVKRSNNCSHIRILCYKEARDINRGIFSLRYKRHYPRHQNMKYIKISIASLIHFEILSDTSTDERHEINVKIFFDDLSNTFGALINHSEFNKVESLD